MVYAGPIGTLVRFSRLVSEAPAPAQILPLLGEAALDLLAADGAAVLSVTAAGELELTAAHRLPPQLSHFRVPGDIIGPELGTQLLLACGGGFAQAHTVPLVSGDLFGALVILYRGKTALAREQIDLAEGLADLTALALAKASQMEELSRSYAELKSSREVLARNEKLRALGQMASGVSHDLRNILSPLLMQVQLLRRMRPGPEDEEDRQDTLQRMEGVLWRGVELVDRLRGFSRQTPESPVVRLDVNQLVSDTMDLCRPRLLAQQVQLREQRGAPPPVLAHGGDFLGVVLNLVVNALDVMPAGGTLTVTTGAHEGGAQVLVGDTGPGISPEVESHLFEPFFTTKGDKGTGLGLSLVYAFAQRHGGNVSVASTPGAGARFTLWLPAARSV